MLLIKVIQYKYKRSTKLNRKYGSIDATHGIRNAWGFLRFIFHSIEVVLNGRAKG